MSAAFTGVDGKPQIPGRGTGNRYPARGERSVLNGKPVVADGKGNWVDGSKPMVPMSERPTVGNYNPGLRFPSVEAIQAGEYGSSKSSDQKTGIPPQAAVDSNGSNGSRGGNRSGVTPVNGSFRTAVEQGPNGDATPGSGNAGSGSFKPKPEPESKDQRTNANGLVSYGKDLSSLNQFTREFTGGYELTDIKSAFQSEDLPTAYQSGSNSISTEETSYELPKGASPSPLNEGLAGASDLQISDSGYTIGEASVPGTVGRSGDAQEGSSAKPDIAEGVRTLRMKRNSGRGSRRDPRNRGEDPDMFGGPEPSDASLVSPMYKNAKRNKIRSTFLDHEGNSIQAITAARAVAGVGNDSNGSDVYNVGGELVYAKAGEERKAINTLMSGNNPMAHLDMPATADTKPDSPAPAELNSSFEKETPDAQAFFKKAVQKVKDETK